jgi:hypothetical protein
MLEHCMKLAALFLITAVAGAQIQPVVTDNQGNGNVDWSKRMIVATGIGAPNPDLPQAAQRPAAERAAQQIALRNALETVKGIFINSSTTVKNFMTTSDVITSRVSGFVQGFQQKGRTKYMSDGTVEITMEIPLDGIGNIGDLILGEKIGDKPSITKFEGKKAKKEQIFTGLIIDCRGLGVKPALSPRVLDSGGREIYGSAYVTKEWAVKYGIVGYSKDVAKAAKLDRVGKNPGQVKAEKASGDNKTDVVISDDDAADIRSASKNLKFLSECRVIFVVD